ncbi:MAG: DUF552 domain-containing protein [Aphanocapsa feldmannii 277cV]|uniref:Cell division protein SepF n=2 Tax=Aphanocapsa feldmannii TaxID=192050 RepID=A0A524RPZ5_9CHRO|nr:MAG: DUF552 domain-containing protein [Aphanocapsa feldmannii 288cV]TGG93077.1 MAG: DUF552 domain-containing protein [Aphanocapsa feldmannii 277cV]TGH23256.1 MAG: DUF552 domain-containing protein [Aphanocapsa feldmannii 277cI]
MSLIDRIRAVVSGEDYDLEEGLDYDTDQQSGNGPLPPGGPLSEPSDFDEPVGFGPPNVIEMPGISSGAAEVLVMEPRSFDEMPSAIQALRERKTVILNLTMMESDQAQRAVDFVAGGTFAIDGHQERVGESIFLFAPSCVTVTTSSSEEPTASTTSISRSTADSRQGESSAPAPAWSEAGEHLAGGL